MGNANNDKLVGPKQQSDLEKKPQKISFSQIVSSGRYQAAILNTLGSEKDAKEFTTSIITTYNKTLPLIQQMDGSAEIITKDMRLIEQFWQPIRALFSR